LLHFKIIDAYELWQRLLEERGLLTFDDFLVFAHRHLASHEDVRRKWASSWDYVLQDECQDASLAQNQIAKLLAQDHKNYMIVGDYRQAIYEWRGADPKMMLAFEKEWGARRIGLMRNYRSGKAIVRVANALTNEVGVDAMVADRSEEGIVRIVHVTDAEAEARAFADFVQEGIADGLTPGHFALLYRTNDLSRSFEEILLSRAIPHEVVGGANFYERKEIKDLLAYLRCAIEMNGEATRRCINAPFRFLGKAFVDRVEAAMEFETEDPVLVVREVAKQQGIQKRQKQSVDEWCAIVTEIRALEEAKTRPSTLLQKIILQTKYIDWLRKDEGEDDIDSSRSKNVQELLRSAERFETTYEFLQYVRENDANTRRRKGQRGDRVRLMTIHRSKGLEFSRVWLASFVEGSLPHFKGDPDSERRVAYVGMTRAQDELVFGVPETIMTSKGAKEIYPSRYLAEIGIGGEKKEKKLPSLDRHTTSVA
jgi:DNA helicase-2/ATP-dependent DNA helicase PcrA